VSNLDFYNDDPVDFKRPKSKKRISGVLALIAALIGGTLYIQTTLAANISLNSGSVEFGQGITQTVACSGSQSLTITPLSTFVNASGGGSYKFSGITVDNIPTSCQDTDFTFSAYNNVAASAAQAIFNTSSTRAVVYMTSTNAFEVGTGGSGLSVATNSASSFTLTFTAPVAPSSAVNKVTVESAAHTAITYNVGDTGPGGGKIFYVADTSFSCGPTLNLSCNYLEAAPPLWNAGGADPGLTWAQSTYFTTSVGGTETGIGLGFQNTRAIILQGNTDTATSAAALADAYTVTVSDVVYDDWYLPSKNELNNLRDKRVTVGGFANYYYWSSSQYNASNAWSHNFSQVSPTAVGKNGPFYIRPIRAF